MGRVIICLGEESEKNGGRQPATQNLLTHLMGVAAVPADSRGRWVDDGLIDLRWCVGEWDERQK